MDVNGILRDCRERMGKSLAYFQRELRGIRTGRATTALIDYVKVDYYGSPTELRELAAVSVPEPTMLLVKPFDPSSQSNIIKALETADLGLNPRPDGPAIRIGVTPPSAERRKQLMKQVKKMDALWPYPRCAAISEDNGKAAKDEVESLTKKHVEQIDGTCDKKVAEIDKT